MREIVLNTAYWPHMLLLTADVLLLLCGTFNRTSLGVTLRLALAVMAISHGFALWHA